MIGYLFGGVFMLAVAVVAYTVGGGGAVIPAMTVAGIGLGVLVIAWMIRMHQARENTTNRMVRLLREHPLQPSDRTAVDPILDEPAGAINAELQDLIQERVTQWKAWHERR